MGLKSVIATQLHELAARAATGDELARSALIAASLPIVRQVARQLVDDPHAADDVTQEALLEVHRSITTLREPAGYRSWLALIVRKHADRYRRRLRPTTMLDLVPEPTADESADPAVEAERAERIDLVRQALWSARDSDRTLLALRYFAELTDDELGRLLGISRGAARKRLHDARRRLRFALAPALATPKEMTMSLFGRLIDPTNAPTLPVAASLARQTDPAAAIPTGIKVLDAMAPWPLGGTVDLLGPVHTGQLVLLGEVAHNIGAAIVGVAADEARYDSIPQLSVLLDPEVRIAETVVVQASVDQARSTMDYAARVAATLAAEGWPVLLVVDRAVAERVGPAAFAGLVGISVSGGAVTGIRFAPNAENEAVTEPWPSADGVSVTSTDVLAAGQLPAIDAMASRSAVLAHVGAEQRRLVDRARVLLADATALRSFWSQPFWMAEPFTSVPGAVFTRRQTLDRLAQLVGTPE